MNIAWGLVLIVLGLLAWGGQTLSWVAPDLASRLGLTEEAATTEPAFYADVRGEAIWDAFTLWTLPLAGILLLVDSSAWPAWGLIAGSVYIYFGGRGVLARRELAKRKLRAGSASELRAAFVMLPVWAIAGLITVIAAFGGL